MSDAGDKSTDEQAAAEAEAPTQATVQVDVPQTQSSPVGDGWLKRNVHGFIIAAVMVVVAGAFFTIGWFTSTRGDHDRLGMINRIEQRMDGSQQRFPQGGSDQQRPGQQHPGQQGPGQQGPGRWQDDPRPQQGQGQEQAPSDPRTPSNPQAQTTQQGYLGLGLETVTPELEQEYDLSTSSGALVVRLDSRGPAAEAGIEQGDVITSIDGTPVDRQRDVVDVVSKKEAGESVSVTVDRDGQSMTFQVTLAERSAYTNG